MNSGRNTKSCTVSLVSSKLCSRSSHRTRRVACVHRHDPFMGIIMISLPYSVLRHLNCILKPGKLYYVAAFLTCVLLLAQFGLVQVILDRHRFPYRLQCLFKFSCTLISPL
jgi:hypothetical protein